jgi:hypothetical protein
MNLLREQAPTRAIIGGGWAYMQFDQILLPDPGSAGRIISIMKLCDKSFVHHHHHTHPAEPLLGQDLLMVNYSS